MLGSGDSVPVLMHVTYLAHLLTVCSLASQTLSAIGGSGSRDYASLLAHSTGLRPHSGLGSAPNRYCARAERIALGDQVESTSKKKSSPLRYPLRAVYKAWGAAAAGTGAAGEPCGPPYLPQASHLGTPGGDQMEKFLWDFSFGYAFLFLKPEGGFVRCFRFRANTEGTENRCYERLITHVVSRI